MINYILKKLCYVILLILLLSVISFFIMYSNSYFYFNTSKLDSELYMNNTIKVVNIIDIADDEDEVNEKKDISVFNQYLHWIKKILAGDFGYSNSYRQNVYDIIKYPVLTTIKLTLISLLFVTIASIPLGVMAAVKRYSRYDNIIGNFSIVGISLPPFVIAILFIYIFSIKLNILPYRAVQPDIVTDNSFMSIAKSLQYNILPILVMSVAPMSNIIRYIRIEMTGVLRKDYIRLAKAKGLKKIHIIYTHAFKNIMDSIISMLTWGFSAILASTVVVESIFSINGAGQLLIDSLKQRDGIIILTINIVYIIIAILGSACMDIINYISKAPSAKA